MADHLRKQIREAVVTALQGGALLASRVYEGGSRPVEEEDLPLCLVYTKEEEAELLTATRQRRLLQLSLRFYVIGGTPVDDLDALCAFAVERIGATALGGLIKWIYETGTVIDLEEEGHKPAGSATMNWLVEYHTDVTDATVVLD